jgi:hypothetical protein
MFSGKRPTGGWLVSAEEYLINQAVDGMVEWAHTTFPNGQFDEAKIRAEGLARSVPDAEVEMVLEELKISAGFETAEYKGRRGRFMSHDERGVTIQYYDGAEPSSQTVPSKDVVFPDRQYVAAVDAGTPGEEHLWNLLDNVPSETKDFVHAMEHAVKIVEALNKLLGTSNLSPVDQDKYDRMLGTITFAHGQVEQRKRPEAILGAIEQLKEIRKESSVDVIVSMITRVQKGASMDVRAELDWAESHGDMLRERALKRTNADPVVKDFVAKHRPIMKSLGRGGRVSIDFEGAALRWMRPDVVEQARALVGKEMQISRPINRPGDLASPRDNDDPDWGKKPGEKYVGDRYSHPTSQHGDQVDDVGRVAYAYFPTNIHGHGELSAIMNTGEEYPAYILKEKSESQSELPGLESSPGERMPTPSGGTEISGEERARLQQRQREKEQGFWPTQAGVVENSMIREVFNQSLRQCSTDGRELQWIWPLIKNLDTTLVHANTGATDPQATIRAAFLMGQCTCELWRKAVAEVKKELGPEIKKTVEGLSRWGTVNPSEAAVRDVVLKALQARQIYPYPDFVQEIMHSLGYNPWGESGFQTRGLGAETDRSPQRESSVQASTSSKGWIAL